jgi:DNA repair exonuclease SbcCD ATPase subunit
MANCIPSIHPFCLIWSIGLPRSARQDSEVIDKGERLDRAQRALERSLQRISDAESAAAAKRAAAESARRRAAVAKSEAQAARAIAKAVRDRADAAAKSGPPVPPGVFGDAARTEKAARDADARSRRADADATKTAADARQAAERQRILQPLKTDVERARQQYGDALERAKAKANLEKQRVVPSNQQSCVPRISRHTGLYAGAGAGQQITVCDDVRTTGAPSPKAGLIRCPTSALGA